MSRIAECLEQLKLNGRKVLIPYIVAGDPKPSFTVPMLHELVEQGADIIELGIPFSDPMADGPVIQLGHERALEQSIDLHSVLAMVAEFRARNQITPIVLMGYANPIARMGFDKFAALASKAGVDGVLTVDMPPEESTALHHALRAVSVDTIFLIAPTTTSARIEKIVSLATGYLYYVSLKGVTGAGSLDVISVKEKLTEIQAVTDLPVAVGFGIKDAASATTIAQLADGVVVGSILVGKMAELSRQSQSIDDAVKQTASIIAEMRVAVDKSLDVA